MHYYEFFQKSIWKKSHEIIDKTEGVSNERKEFYHIMLNERYKQIIKEPYLQYMKIKDAYDNSESQSGSSYAKYKDDFDLEL